MVQLKYFGDSRDYFKYDLIRSVFEVSSLRHYVFVPMLTEHRDDNEGRTKPINSGNKSDELLAYIAGRDGKSLKHWDHWLTQYVQSYNTIEPVDGMFFSDSGRDAYWVEFQPLLSQSNALVFVDPDTGLETGNPSYLRNMGREKYILDGEIRFFIEQLHPSSVLMIYQHLPHDKRVHTASVAKKRAQVRSVNATAHVCAYREDDLAFIFVSKAQRLDREIQGILSDYHTRSNHDYKSLHI